jgi:prepilin-type N-terminal cleavage/methylation domain-containing protein
MLERKGKMLKRCCELNQGGFTLIELMSVMVIFSVIASVGVKKIDFISDTATERAMLEGVKELNTRESLTWINIKLSPAGWTDDAQNFAALDKDLGSDYQWTAGPNAFGGTLNFRGQSVVLSRVVSTNKTSGYWQ